MQRHSALFCFFLLLIDDAVSFSLNPWKKKSSTLPVITLHGVQNYAVLELYKKPLVYEIPPGHKFKAVTDLSKKRLVGFVNRGELRPFVIPHGEGFQKVEIPIIDDEARNPVVVDPLNNALKQLRNKVNNNWKDYIRHFKLSPFSAIGRGVVTIYGVRQFLCPDPKGVPQVRRLHRGVSLSCLTDPTRSKISGVMYDGSVCSFVVPEGKHFKKVEVLIIKNKATEIIDVDQHHDPLQDFEFSEVHWTHYIRKARIALSKNPAHRSQ